jgi:hypothetical protein
MTCLVFNSCSLISVDRRDSKSIADWRSDLPLFSDYFIQVNLLSALCHFITSIYGLARQASVATINRGPGFDMYK